MNRAWALLILVVVVLALLAPTGCANLSPRQQHALTGGVAGTAAGAVLGALAGNAAVGAAIGGATGLAAGALWRDVESAL
jgi:osmotically inducible lipoprotein OsmB